MNPTRWRKRPHNSRGSAFFDRPTLVSSISARRKNSVSVAPGVRQDTVTLAARPEEANGSFERALQSPPRMSPRLSLNTP
jgi:hypothetical protein